MVAFNENDNQAIVSTGLSNASRGVPADESLGILFKGLGDTLQNGLNAFDESTKVKIEMMADQAVNGPGGAVAEASPDANGNLPPSAQASLGNIASYRNALDQGAISQVTFDNRVATEAKRIRASVPPGYGPMVERALSSAVGASTANQARQTQLAAMKQAQSAQSKVMKNMNDWMEKESNQKMLLDANVKQNFSMLTGGKMTVEQMMLNPDPANFKLLQLAVANRQAIDSNVARVESEIKARDLIRNDQVNVLADKFIEDSFNANISKEYSTFISIRNSASDPRSPGGASWTPDEERQVAAAYQAFDLGARSNMESWMAKNQVGDSVRANLRTRIDERLKPWKNFLDDPNMGALGAQDRLWNGQQREIAQKLAGSVDLMPLLMGMQKNGVPPDIQSAILNKLAEGKSKEQLIGQLSDPALLASLSGIVTIPEAINVLAGQSDNPNRDVKKYFDDLAMSLGVSTQNPQGTAGIAKAIFDPKNKGILDKLATENRIGTFEKFVTPQMIDALVKSGDKGALAFATQWANDQFDVIARPAQNTVWERQANSGSIEFKFENGRFSIGSIGGGTPLGNAAVRSAENAIPGLGAYNAITGAWDMRQNSSAMQAVSDINRYIAVMEPVWKAQGIDARTALAVKFGDIGSVKKNGSLFEALGSALISSLNPTSTAQAAPPSYYDKPSNNDPMVRDGIRTAAASLGIDPLDLATAISYETGGTFNPTKNGPKTQWGRHRGFIQFGEPQAAQYGVNWDDPINSQLGPEGAVVKYLRDAGVKPGMGLMDIYSAINAGHVGRNNASDANNGGAPGTVADKVNTQMDGHRERARLLMMSS